MATTCFAQQFDPTTSKAPATLEDDWYYQPREQQKPTAREIVQEKAKFRGQQRLARMAALEWYGFSSARPRANPTPFGSMYSNVWAMPGGRPYAWYPTGQTVVILR